MTTTLHASPVRTKSRRVPRWVWVVLIAMSMPLIAVWAETPDLTSEGLASATLRFTVPILLAGLGGLWAERGGTLNIGLDGMMIIGSWTGAWVGLSYGPWAALLGGVIGGTLSGLFQGLLTQTFGIDQAISGIVINMMAIGIVRFLSSVTFANEPGGSISQSPTLEQLPLLTFPGAEQVLEPLSSAGILFLSDAANITLGLLTNVSYGTLIAFSLVPLTWWILTRTRFGLRVRATGENPAAADSLGVSPYRIHYITQAISGGLAGLGGAYMVVAASSLYREGQIGGRGFIGLATVIFGNWHPGGVLTGSLLFGFTDALRTRQEASVGALLLLGAVLLLARFIWLFAAGRHRESFWYLAFGVPVLLWFFYGDGVPTELVSIAPYLVTLLVLLGAHRTLRPPASVGITYRRSEE
ncbi:ABC transporter permease [Microbacterium sp. NPDC076911]|uniref:ABC transporter permease n=1 Tax=Microbacterium sp. NPDC076911 TaxID=3154958 RepID=UPI003423DA40